MNVKEKTSSGMKWSGIKILALLFTVVVLAGCNKKEEVQLEQSFVLKYKQTATIGKELEIKFYELSDSRCASDAECIIPGELEINLKINGEKIDLILDNPNHTKAVKDGFEIELLGAVPVSFTSNDRPRKKEYHISLVVRKSH